MRKMSVVWREEVSEMIQEVRTGMQEKDNIMIIEETLMFDMKKIMEEAEVDTRVGHLVCDISYRTCACLGTVFVTPPISEWCS